MNKTTNERLYFLDWVRIIAFFVLILYHTGMYYVTWGWHVKSVDASHALEPLMWLSSPWRLSLLFLVSGVASAFMLRRLSAASFMRSRSWRLLLPLIFGMLVIVPPQPYFEVIEKLAYQGSYGDFMQLYLRAYPGFCKDGSCLDLPTWNHLWFVAYLWLYTLVLGMLVMALGRRFDGLALWVGRQLTGWKIVALPLFVLAAARLALVGRFPATHDVVNDWYNHANYLPLFLLGALIARQSGFWQQVAAMRWAMLGIALACWAFLVVYFSAPDDMISESVMTVLQPLQRIIYATCEWCAILAACGFARQHLQFDSPARRYLAQAVFPVYILHQSLIVVLAHSLKPVHLPPATEGLVLVVLTLTLSFAGVELLRVAGPLRPLFGLTWERKRAGVVTAVPAGA